MFIFITGAITEKEGIISRGKTMGAQQCSRTAFSANGRSEERAQLIGTQSRFLAGSLFDTSNTGILLRQNSIC